MVNFQTRGCNRKQSLTMHLIHLCSWLCSACVKPLEDCMWSFIIVNLQRGMISLKHLCTAMEGSLKQKQFCRSSSSQVSLFNIQEGEIQHLASKKTNLWVTMEMFLHLRPGNGLETHAWLLPFLFLGVVSNGDNNKWAQFWQNRWQVCFSNAHFTGHKTVTYIHIKG